VDTGARGRATARVDPDDAESVVAALAPQLSAGEQRLLAHAIERGRPVKIQYTNAQGNQSTRVIEPIELYGRVVGAWCHLREEERMFALDRIDAVAPAVTP
jgi:predicted DNA-binding transcriptional regulator YafY